MALGTAAAIGLGASALGIGLQAQAGKEMASAAGNAARAQLDEERASRAQALKFAEPSVEELMQAKKAIEIQDREVARKEKLLSSIDPALMEAGQQALKLLRGQEAATLEPIKMERARQRQQLQNTLQSQLGGGYATSTAGIEALTRFDQETSGLMANAQQQSLNSLLGLSASVRPNMGQAAQETAALSSPFANMKNRQVAALTGTPIQNAGAPFVSDIYNARNNQQLFGGLSNLGGQAIGYGLLSQFSNQQNPSGQYNTLGYMSGGSQDYQSNPWSVGNKNDFSFR